MSITLLFLTPPEANSKCHSPLTLGAPETGENKAACHRGHSQPVTELRIRTQCLSGSAPSRLEFPQ